MLTKAQRERIQGIINTYRNPKSSMDYHLVGFYRERSMSGKSETFRYQLQRSGCLGGYLVTRTHMLFSVEIKSLPDGTDDPASWAKYEAACAEAMKMLEGAE
jgi:hypothetical protein